jgi:pimeloyl-ACP methyl ester carboxylesterase
MNLHPEVVGALVLVEPTPDDMFRREPQELERFERGPLEAVFDAVSSSRSLVGLQRLFSQKDPETSKWWVDKQLYRTVKHRRTATAESRAMPESCEQVLAARVPWGDIPLLLLFGQHTWSSADRGDIAWATELVGRSSRGRIKVVEGAGHGIPWERPEALVAAVDSIIPILGQTNDAPK